MARSNFSFEKRQKELAKKKKKEEKQQRKKEKSSAGSDNAGDLAQDENGVGLDKES